MVGKADLHIHSICSDGTLSPQEIIKKACKAGLQAISITDHDNIDAIEPAMTFCKQCALEFIPGIEISSEYEKNEVHFLGYFFDHRHKILNEYVQYFQNERKKRARKILEQLRKMGMKIGLELVLQKTAHHGSICRPHIAHVLVEEGYVHSYQEAFYKYLGANCPCYVPKYKIEPAEAIKIINQAGGISFIAHPGLALKEYSILKLIELGIEGIETVHPRHSTDDIEYYRKLIQKYDLLECGGSDFHDNRKQNSIFGKYTVPYDVIIKMKKWLSSKRKDNTGGIL